MTRIDQFESTFRSAAHDRLQYEAIQFKKILLISDKSEAESAPILDSLKKHLSVLNTPSGPSYSLLAGDKTVSTENLISEAESSGADLICTWRNLHTQDWRMPHGLGSQLDVLLQKVNIPVLVLPHPDADYSSAHANINTDKVMVITDHLANDDRLVNMAVRMTAPNGILYLTHYEDEDVFERYMNAISKISTIETESARQSIRAQLLKEASYYIETCREVLKEHHLSITVESHVAFGHRLSSCHDHIARQEIDLLVMNTRDDDQMAMHGMAYPLAVELREIPVLML
jgi:nucleotide-binding universal stress UspA family protein